MAALMLVDGNYIVRTIYEAASATDAGSPDLIYRVQLTIVDSLRRAVYDHRPTHALVAFDPGGTTWRHHLYGEYKSGRTPMNQALRSAFPDIQHALRDELGLASLTIPGVEADDIIATAARAWRGAGKDRCIVLARDKDLCQLVADGVHVRDHFGRQWRTEEWIANKFGVSSRLLTDFLALQGDASDNIPGVAGIGPVTAARLLTRYGSIDAIYDNLGALPPADARKLAAGEASARLSRRLVTFQEGLTLGISAADLRIGMAGSDIRDSDPSTPSIPQQCRRMTV